MTAVGSYNEQNSKFRGAKGGVVVQGGRTIEVGVYLFHN